jgi:hypothetical protein
MIDLSAIMKEGCNVVDVYVCPVVSDHRDKYDVHVAWSAEQKLGNGLGKGSTQELKEYYHSDMVYVYDHANDGQKVLRRLARHEVSYQNMYAISFMEEVLPSHRFPCTKDIMHEEDVTRTMFRINNRMYFVHDVDTKGHHYYYVRYQHSDNVDIKKMQSDLDRVCSYLMKIKMIRR